MKVEQEFLSNDTSERELVITRLLHAPRELVFDVWTNPDHVKNWWGPNGFTNTIHKMEVTKGGEWNFVMHGPDGKDYKNKIIFTEVVRPERLCYDHVSGPKFHVTVDFAKQGNTTLLTMRMVFDSSDQLAQAIKQFGADEGLKQHIHRLAEYLEVNTIVNK